MTRSTLLKSFFTVGLLCALLTGCGTENNVGTGVANPPSSTTKAAAAIAAVFSTTDANGSIASQWIIVEQPLHQVDPDGQPCAENDPACTCSDADVGNERIAIQQSGASGLYGSQDNSLTVTEADFCEMENGTDNTGNGPDGDGLVNAFTLLQDIPVNCEGETSTISMGADSSGVYRNTVESQTGTAYWPQIYGSFLFNVDDVSTVIDCTIFLAENQTILFADCSDSNGNTLNLDSDVTCTVDSGENE